MTSRRATLVEVGLRDGLQPITTFVLTARKIALMRGLYDAGVRRAEVTSFVSARAVPQLADAADVLAAAQELPGFDPQVLVPSRSQADRALAAGAGHIAFVLSVSEKHNMNNIRRLPADSIDEYGALAMSLPKSVRIRINLATAFDCPFDGHVADHETLDIITGLAQFRSDVEIALCDTTGRVTPDHVARLFDAARQRAPDVRDWAFHGHDTYGMGVANVMAAWSAGITTFDGSFGGLGGCPYAPGATGNVASEDIAYLFAKMGIDTGIDLDRLVRVAAEGADLPGAAAGGRVRLAMQASRNA